MSDNYLAQVKQCQTMYEKVSKCQHLRKFLTFLHWLRLFSEINRNFWNFEKKFLDYFVERQKWQLSLNVELEQPPLKFCFPKNLFLIVKTMCFWGSLSKLYQLVTYVTSDQTRKASPKKTDNFVISFPRLTNEPILSSRFWRTKNWKWCRK